MAQKRKRQPDPADSSHDPRISAQPTKTRRTTRHTAALARPPPPPPPAPPKPNTTTPISLPTPASAPVNPPKRGRGRPPNSRRQPPPSEVSPETAPPQVLRWTPPKVPSQNSQAQSPTQTQTNTKAPAAAMNSIGHNYSARPSDLGAPEITYQVRQTAQQPSYRTSELVRLHGPTAQPPPLSQTLTPVFPPKPPAPAPLRADRNIDKVVLGNICFRTWYPSYYGKEVLGDSSGAARGGSGDGGKDLGGKSSSKGKDREHHQPMLERLYVCPSCFKYSKELVAWWGHVRVCERQNNVPGKKIYTHPRGQRRILVPQQPTEPGPRRRRTGAKVKYVEETVIDEGEWSIWEVDGEVDSLFCQNLSLFAKLFLDQKSVFFDVAVFNYFLLVYTPPTKPPAPGETEPAKPPTPQVVGFFSKEKLSWDSNNLACILVFPPWQRKGLGALLMGVSYEMARREGLMGGPEKPISDLGKKGYKRYWAGEIARWLLSLDTSTTSGQEVLVDVDDCSRATWILPEDCLLMLREMGIAAEAGMGPGKTEAQNNDDKADEENATGGEEQDKVVKLVPRVRVDKQAVRAYVAEHRISLERACNPAGFVEGYAMKTATSEEEEAEE